MSQNKSEKRSEKWTTNISITILGVMFFIFGFITWLNSILIPYFKIGCELTNVEAYLVAFSFYIAYLFMSVPSSLILERIGFKRGMMLGFFTMAAGCFIFIPAALYRTYSLFLLGLFLIGTGLAMLQTASNPYITIIGPISHAVQRISIMGICNKVAGIVAPLIFAAVVLKVSDSLMTESISSNLLGSGEKDALLNEYIRRVIFPYSVLGTLLTLFGIFIYYSPLPEINTEKSNKEELSDKDSGRKNIFQFPFLVLGAIALFFHVGSQVIAIDTIIGYAQTMGMSLLDAKIFPSLTLFATMCGYILGIICVPRFISQRNALLLCTVLGMILSVGVLTMHGDLMFLGHKVDVSILFLSALGFPNSLIYAGIWPLSIKGLGRFTKLGSSIMIMGLCGSAITPVIYGHLADHYSASFSYIILIPCYLYLIFFASYGYKIKSWRRQRELVS